MQMVGTNWSKLGEHVTLLGLIPVTNLNLTAKKLPDNRAGFTINGRKCGATLGKTLQVIGRFGFWIVFRYLLEFDNIAVIANRQR